MKALLAAAAGVLMIGAVGASDLNAQGVNIRINKGNKRVEVDTRGRAPEVRITRERPAPQAGHYITVKKKVWHPGHYDTISERVWVPEQRRDVVENVYVPGKYVTVRERRLDSHGCVIFVDVCKYVPAHYEQVTRCVVIPAHYETCQKQVWVEGHYDIVEERVWVSGNGHNHTVRR
jgi:hypothetical protein